MVVAAYPDSALLLEALQIGPVAITKKPFTLDELHRALGMADSSQDARSKQK